MTTFKRIATRCQSVLLLVLLVILPITAYNAGRVTRAKAVIPAVLIQRRHQEFDRIVADLRPHGLVYDINKQVTIGDKTVTLARLAVDRDVAFLEFGSDIPPNLNFDLSAGNGPSALTGPEWVYTEFNFTPDPAVSTLTIEVQDFHGNPTLDERVPVAVDLSALGALPKPQAVPTTVTTNGVRVAIGGLRRGYAVTSVNLSGVVVNPQALQMMTLSQSIPISPEADPALVLGEDWPLRANVRGSSIPVIGSGVSEFTSGDWNETVQLLDLPIRGDLDLRLEWIFLPNAVQSSKIQFAIGPWNLMVPIPQSQ